jgi:outer membrane lipoprotein-sorting protein
MSSRRPVRVSVVTVLVALAACGRGGSGGGRDATSPRPAAFRPTRLPSNGLEVIGWMRHTHPSRELRSLAFTISTTEYRADSTMQARARVYAALPGRLRVDVLPSSRRSGYIRNRQWMAVFERGRRVSTSSRVDLSTLLTYDLFAQSTDTTIMWLDSARVRFGLVRRDELDGRRVYVVGATKGDTTSAQFWVDAERWRVLRIIQREARTPSQISDLRFSEYKELLDVPVPMRIQVYRGGRLVQRQEISDVEVNPSLPSRTFDLSRWRAVSLRLQSSDEP